MAAADAGIRASSDSTISGVTPGIRSTSRYWRGPPTRGGGAPSARSVVASTSPMVPGGTDRTRPDCRPRHLRPSGGPFQAGVLGRVDGEGERGRGERVVEVGRDG